MDSKSTSNAIIVIILLTLEIIVLAGVQIPSEGTFLAIGEGRGEGGGGGVNERGDTPFPTVRHPTMFMFSCSVAYFSRTESRRRKTGIEKAL